MIELKPTDFYVGLDPGTTETGLCSVKKDHTIISAEKIFNDKVLSYLKDFAGNIIEVAIESIQSYGMQMGASTIETCYQIGRIIQVCCDNNIAYRLIPRPIYGKYITGTGKVKDALIKSSLENRFGSYSKGKKEIKLKNGTIKQALELPGPLVKLNGSTDVKSAFAVCVYMIDCIEEEKKNV